MTPSPSAKVLVTGGAGYIGSHAVLSLLDSGYEVVVLDELSTGTRSAVPDAVRFILGDCGDPILLDAIFREHRIDAVMHFAAKIVVPESVANPIFYYQSNTCVTATLIEKCLAHKVNIFVFSSTAAVYGQPDSDLVAESAPTRPMNPYGRSKLMCEDMLRDASYAFPEFRHAALRYFNVAGADPGGRTGSRSKAPTNLFGVAIDRALGLRGSIEIFGTDYPTSDGTCERDYIHVTDLADIHVQTLTSLLDGGRSDVFNCGYGKGYSVREVIAALEAQVGYSLSPQCSPRRPGDPARVISDVSHLRAVLNWHPGHDDLVEMLGTALAWRQRMSAGVDGPAQPGRVS